MEGYINILVYVHAIFGGLALLSGLVSIIAKKGGQTHKRFGLIFYYTMIISGVTAMFVATMPDHENLFLFSVGIFSLYFVLTGRRALKFKYNNPNLKIDYLISSIMLITGLSILIIPIILTRSIHIVISVFAVVEIAFSIGDFLNYGKPEKIKQNWLKIHLGKMLGGYIAATTAFVVVNQFFPSFYGWFIPGVIGGIVITFWSRKMSNKNKEKSPSV